MVYGGIERNNMQGHTHLVNVKGHVILLGFQPVIVWY